MPDPNAGKFGNFRDYFWEQAVSGAGVDVFKYSTMVTVFTLWPCDYELFSELTPYAQIGVWEEGLELRTKDQECLICNEPLHMHEWHLHTIICPDGYEYLKD